MKNTYSNDVASRSGKIVLKVIDAGKGIPVELQSIIFDRFRFQNELPIAGLGLPLSSRLFALHAAELSVEKSTTEGTVMRCEFKEALELT